SFPVEEGDGPRQKGNLNRLATEGAVNSASNSIVEQYSAPYVLFLKATNTEMGLLGLAQHLANVIAQIPGAKLAQHFSRKSVWIATQLAAKLLLVPLAILPLLFPNPVTIAIAILGLVSFFINLRKPAWISLLGDIVPQEMRAQYFGKRNALIGISGFVSTLLAGVILALYGFSVIFFLSILLGVMIVFYFAKIHEPAMGKRRHSYHYNLSSSIESVREAATINRSFIMLTSYMTYINFAIEMVVPFIVVYMLKDLGLSYAEFGMVVALGVLSKVISSRYWGRMSGKFGDRTLIGVTGILVCFVPLGYVLSSNVYHIALLRLYDGFVFAGFELMTFDYLLNITPQDKRPSYIGGHHFFTGIGAILGALVGVLLVGQVESSSFAFLQGLQILFMLSFILRLGALGFIPFISETSSKAEGIPFRHIFAEAVALEPVREIKYTVGESFRVPYNIGKGEVERIGRLHSRPAIRDVEFGISYRLMRLSTWLRFKMIALKNMRRHSYRIGRELVD
ncbi:MAG: MFS transporter, partial [Candidatus Aenigmarchaeota archaeon]|nr:MFS transporter [Candidatus Aenigmarchaeota archaeon]